MATRFDCAFQGSGLVENYAIPGYPDYEWRRVANDYPESLALSMSGVTAPVSQSMAYILWKKSTNAAATFEAPVTVELYSESVSGGHAIVFTGTPSESLGPGIWSLGSAPTGMGITGAASEIRAGDAPHARPSSQTTLSGSFGTFAGSGVRKIALRSVSSSQVAYSIDNTQLGTIDSWPISNPTGIMFCLSNGRVVTRIRVYDNNDPSPSLPPDPEPEPANWWRGLANAVQTL